MRRLGPYTVIALLCVLILAGIGSPVAAGPGPRSPATPAQSLDVLQPVDADQVFMLVSMQRNGDAGWQIQYRVELETENETAAFEELQGDIQANRSTYTSNFRPGVEATIAEAENVTGREMELENLTVRATTQQFGQYGVVTYAFNWTNFARVEGDSLRGGDALAGLFLDSSTSLRMEWPSAYEATQVRPAADERAETFVRWEGERTFGSGEPRVVLQPGGPSGPFGGVNPVVIGGIGAVILVIIVGLIWYLRRGEREPEPTPSPTTTATESGDISESPPDDEEEQEPPEELLSNEERVMRLLEANSGRIKQQRVVEELDWTAAKTSQVVNGMKDDGTIEVFRLGRENVLRIPESDEESEETDT